VPYLQTPHSAPSPVEENEVGFLKDKTFYNDDCGSTRVGTTSLHCITFRMLTLTLLLLLKSVGIDDDFALLRVIQAGSCVNPKMPP